MEQKLDFIEKEIQRLLFFMENLLKLGSKINHSNFETVVNDIDDNLKKEFNLSINSLETLSNEDFLNKLTKLSNHQLDEFVLFLSNLEVSAKNNNLEFKDLDKKIAVIIEYLDANSTDFSVQRMQIKDRFKIN
jgi:hypothetical protein